jgi:DNA helicase HerA-like ATPase
VFLADVKGDLSGLAAAGSMTPKLRDRLTSTGNAEPAWRANPVVFWDVLAKRGLPVRATISDLGPLLLGRLLSLNPTQQGVLAIVFKIADDNRLLLLDLKDLRAMLQFVGDNASQFRTEYGNVSAASIGAIQRGLLEIEQQGGTQFFGEPMLDVDDLLQTDEHGGGIVSVLVADDRSGIRRSTRRFCCGCCPGYGRLPKSAIPRNRSWCFSLTRRTCCFRTRRRRWSRRSSRSCA